jgi:hypothetical protein
MNIKQLYIVLFAQDGKTALGFVKVVYQGEEALISAQVNIRTENSADLCLEDGAFVACLAMQNRPIGLTASGKVKLGSGRIVAMVIGQRGLLALGQSTMPKANWRAQEASCRKRMEQSPKGTTLPVSEGMRQQIPAQHLFKPPKEQVPMAGPPQLAPASEDPGTATAGLPIPSAVQLAWMADRRDSTGPGESCERDAPFSVRDAKIWPAEMPPQTYEEPGDKTPAQIGRVPMYSSRLKPLVWEKEEAKEACGPKAEECGPDLTLPEIPCGKDERPQEQPQPEVAEPFREEGIRLSVAGPLADSWQWHKAVSKEADYSYLMGEAILDGKVIAVAIAVPGDYAPSPPANLQGFNAYRDGHWILAQDAETGDIVDI